MKWDLAQIVDDLSLSQDVLQQLDPILLEYEGEAAGAFESSFESTLKLQESIEKLTAESGAAGSGQPRRYRGYRDIWEGSGRAMREARQKVAQLNRRVLDRLTDLLPAATAGQLRVAYNRNGDNISFFPPANIQAVAGTTQTAGDITTLIATVSAGLDTNLDLILADTDELQGDDVPAGPNRRANPRLLQEPQGPAAGHHPGATQPGHAW